MTTADLLNILASTLRVSTPLIFAALGGCLSERSGVVNISLEGKMLVGAFWAASVGAWTHNPELALVAGALAGAAIGALYAFFVVFLSANQIVVGTAINFFAMGLCPFFSRIFFGSTGSTPMLPLESRFTIFPLWLAWGLVVVVSLFFKKTRGGLIVAFAGEKPNALDAAGLSVAKTRWASVVAAGFLAGLGGASLSVYLSSGFSRNMTAGRGFMALAALILGKWRPFPAALACVFFGLTEALQIQLQGVVLWGTDPVPVQFIQILPYVVTVVVLAGWVGSSRPPKALGIHYETH